MLNKFCFVIVALVSFLFGSSYAGSVSTARQVEIPCKLKPAIKRSLPPQLTFPPNPKIQYGVIFNGVWAEGYSSGFILAGAGKVDINIFNMLPESDQKIGRIIINIAAICTGSNKKKYLEVAGDSMVCEKGEGLTIKLYDPECDGVSVNKRGVFTLTETRDVDEQKVVSAEQPPPIFVNVTNPDVPDSIIVGEAAVQPFAAAAVPTYIRTAPVTPPQPLPPSATIVASHYDRTAPVDHLQPLILGEVPPGTVLGGDAPQPSLADFGFEYANAAGDTPIQPPMVAAPAYDRTAPVVPPSYVGGATAWHVYRHMAEPAAPQQPNLTATDCIRGASIVLRDGQVDLRGLSITPQSGTSIGHRQLSIGSYRPKY